MAEKRQATRQHRRLKLRYGSDSLLKLAFTEDVSATGMFIKTSTVMKPGSLITIELYAIDGTTILLKGLVMWGKKVSYELISQIKKAGMGIKIVEKVSGEDSYQRL
jgi:hypothetical protein